MSELQAFELGDPRTELRRQLVAAVLDGRKTATSSLRVEYAPHTADRLPRAGDRSPLAGFDGKPLDVVIETTEVRIIRASDVDLDFARDEGEGFDSVADWWRAHDRFWTSHGIIDQLRADTLVVCEHFRIVESHP
jgi:uncharacterized protein YhfF